jgi:hypothetical protein
MTKHILTLCFLLALSFQMSAQDFVTFELQAGDQTYTLTQEIDPSFLGTYVKGKGTDRIQCQISQTEGESFILSMKDNADDAHFEWDFENKENIRWGVLVKDNQLVSTDVMEYAGGEMVSYSAFSVLIFRDGAEKPQEWMLYELNGKKFLGQAEKVEVVAENR